MLRAFTPPGGGGGGGISGSGTAGTLAKFTGATALGDSLLSESGTTITSAATAEAFGSPQTWTVGAPNAFALIVKSNAGPESTLVLDTISRAAGIGGAPGTLLHVQDAAGYPFAGSTYDGVRLQRSTEALFSASDYTRSFRAGLTGSTAVVGTSTAHDLLLQRGNVTALTLGASGAVAFAGNLTSSATQTWTLATGTSALNIQSGLLNLDTTNSRVGFGTASPQEKAQVYGNLKVGVLASGSYISLGDEATTQRLIGVFRAPGDTALSLGGYSGIAFTVGAAALGSQTERMRIDSAGNVSIGYAGGTWSSTYTGMFLNRGLSFMARDAGDAYLSANAFFDSSNAWKYVASGSVTSAQIAFQNGITVFNRAIAGTAGSALTWLESARIDAAGNVAIGRTTTVGTIFETQGDIVSFRDAASNVRVRFEAANSLLNVGLGTAGWGVKLPAAPGNADSQTLDCYAEGSVSSTSFTTGITTTSGAITTSILWTRIGRSVKIDITIAPAAGQSLTLANPWYVVGTGVPSVSVSSPVMSICTSLGAVRSSGYVYNSGVTPVFYAFSLGILAADEKVFISVTTQS